MYKIVTDSCCDLSYQFFEKDNLEFLPMEVMLDEKTLRDDLGLTFDIDSFYTALKNGSMPSTSQISIGRYLEFFKSCAKQNIPIIYISLSSGMSGSYQSALQAVDLLKEEYPDAEIAIVDSLSASAGQGLMVYNAVQKQKEGYNFLELVSWLEANKRSYQHWFTVEDLNHLYNGGRISKGAAAIGELLSIKPILSVNKEGKLEVVEKVRTRKRAFQRMTDQVVQALEAADDKTVFIATSGDRAGAEWLKESILAKSHPKSIEVLNMGPTISSHTSYGCVGVFIKGIDSGV